MPASRRLLAALAVAALCGGALTVAVATSNSAAHDEADGTLHLPASRLGERGAYDLQLQGSWTDSPFGGEGARFLEFARAAGGPMRLGDGLVHDVDRVLVAGLRHESAMSPSSYGGQYGTAWRPYTGTLAFEGREPVAWETDLNETRTDVYASQVGGIQLLASTVRTSLAGSVRSFADLGPSCLFRFEGLALAPGDVVEAPHPCAIGGFFAVAPTDWSVGTWDEVDGRPALPLRTLAGFAGSLLGPAPEVAMGPLTMWFTPGIPVPVAVEVAQDGLRFRMTLAGYEPGDEARAVPGAPRDPAPALAYGPRHLWGPDDAGMTFAWSPREAFAQAMADPTFPGLRDYLAAHPKAVNVAVHQFDYQEPGWMFGYSDGKAEYTLLVLKARADTPVPLAPDRYIEYGPEAVDAGEPEPADRLPTWASLAAVWGAYAGKPASEVNRLVSWTYCSTIWPECVELGQASRVEVQQSGRQPDPWSMPPGFREDVSAQEEAIATRDGEVVAYELTTSDLRERPGAAPDGLPDEGAASLGAPEGIRTAAWMPDAGQAAGISLAGILVGLGYYLWPVAKAGVLGLFSRVQGPRLGDHPQRARLLQLLEADPGLHFRELQRRTGLPNGSLLHHLRQLAAGGLVTARRANGYTCYFAGTPPRGAAAAAAATRADGARRLLAAVAAAPGLTSQDAAARAGLQPSTVSYHVQRLVEAGQVTAVRDGRAVRLHPAAGAKPGVAAGA